MDTKLFARKQPGGLFSIYDAAVTTGSYFFVHSGTGTDGAGYGQNPDAPCATIDYAVGLCTASKGDIIYVMPGHAETIAAAGGVTADIAGIKIIGLGIGDTRPTLTFSATDSTFIVSALDVEVVNLKFVSSVNSLVTFLALTAGNSVVRNCKFVTGTATEATAFIALTTTKDNFLIEDCEFWQPTDPEGTDGAANTGCIYCVDSENIHIKNCKAIGEFETAFFHNRTTKAQNVFIEDCIIKQDLAGAEITQMVAATTGFLRGGICMCPDAADALEPAIFGTLSANFFIGADTQISADGAAGEGGAAAAMVANS